MSHQQKFDYGRFAVRIINIVIKNADRPVLFRLLSANSKTATMTKIYYPAARNAMPTLYAYQL